MFYFPPGTKMFQFSGFAPRIATGTRPSAWWVAPFGNQRIYRIFAPPRRLSQLVTSFFASESQGIHHALLFTFLSNQILLTFTFLYSNMSKNFIDCGLRTGDCGLKNPKSKIRIPKSKYYINEVFTRRIPTADHFLPVNSRL